MSRVHFLVGLASAIALAACGGKNDTPSEGCTTEARAGLTVTVFDGSGARVCDATVTAQDGAFSESLMMLGGASSCNYAGAWERAGTYLVHAARGTSQKDATAVVASGTCHVDGQLVTITFD